MEKENKWQLVMFILPILTLAICMGGIMTKNRNVLVKEDSEYLYYKEYKLFNLDSGIYKYHKPIIYKGKVIDKYTRRHFAGLVGKGGHWVTNHHIVFKFDNRIEDEDRGSSFYDLFNKGDNVEVTEKFYPRHELIYKNLK